MAKINSIQLTKADLVAMKTWLAIACIFLGCGRSEPKCKLESRPFVAAAMEADTRFLVLDNGDVVFSANDSEFFALYRYDGVAIEKVDAIQDQRYPFLYNGKITGLRDDNGNEIWRTSEGLFANYFPGTIEVRSVHSFNNGKLLVVQLRQDPSVYLLDLEKGKKSILLHRVNQLHHVEFSEEGGYFIINADDRLLYLDSEGKSVRSLFQASDGHKLNPFIFNDLVYFASYEGTEYFKIYAININLPEEEPRLIHDVMHDIRLPKRSGEDLFYVEIIAGEYFLKRKNMNTGKIESITERGVVYDYSFRGANQLIFVYADFRVPKNLYVYDMESSSIYTITDNTVDIPIDYRFIPASEDLSSAYEFYPLDTANVQGVILFFHPGLRSDFSPRWDAVLANLANNGFRIIAPNYPMSFGFGKTFNQSDFSAGKEDMIRWLSHITKGHQGISIYTLATSSGNILMEHILVERPKSINASASLFGLPASDRYYARVPQLLLFGENDPLVEFSGMLQKMEASDNNKVKWISYPNEGHWFRKSENADHAVKAIVTHFCEYR